MSQTGKCPLCPPSDTAKLLTNGFCGYHYWTGLRTASAEKRLEQKGEDAERCRDWFQYQHEHTRRYVCENCGGRDLPIFNNKVIKSHHAHILPKHLFSSVADHKDNHLLLCGFYTHGGCHTIYDASWSRAAAMPVFELAIERFLSFAHLLTPRELHILPTIFQQRLAHFMEMDVRFFVTNS